MNTRLNLALLGTLALAVAACAPATPTSPSASPSAVPSAPETPGPSSAPTAAPSATPAGWTIAAGEALKPYAFNGVGGLYYEPMRRQIVVLDADKAGATSPRYVMRRFGSDGTYVSTVAINPEGGRAPEAVRGLAFDRQGSPFYTYEDDKAWRLLKLYTATVVGADRLPLSSVKRAGVSTLAASGDEIRVAVVTLDPDTTETRGGKIQVAQAEEDETPTSLFAIEDPLYPTQRMAFLANGDLILTGTTREGRNGWRRVGRDGKAAAWPESPTSFPDLLWGGPDGNLYALHNQLSEPAVLRRFTSEGAPAGEVRLTLGSGGFLSTIKGAALDDQGHLLAVGSGFDAAGKSLSGMYRF